MQSLEKALMTKKLHSVRSDLCGCLHNIGKSGDLSSLLDAERRLVENDLLRYANSKAMISSLKTALTEIDVIKKHVVLVGNPAQYKVINEAYSLSKIGKVICAL
ncbi:hypothetical protein [Bartonella sp. ML71XJBT]|uniref:hypothetical protein n=1 Tax=Bartonella sp. ML71XJBT TaxID=3019094 RepID=UPI00236237AA|nr:hypothetical protein [Bartonella sp. ML71XJBT]